MNEHRFKKKTNERFLAFIRLISNNILCTNRNEGDPWPERKWGDGNRSAVAFCFLFGISRCRRRRRRRRFLVFFFSDFVSIPFGRSGDELLLAFQLPIFGQLAIQRLVVFLLLQPQGPFLHNNINKLVWVQ